MPLPAHTPWQLLVPECVHVTTRICTWLPTYPPPHLQPPPPPKLAAEFGRPRRFVPSICWVSEFRRFVLPLLWVSVILPIRSADLLGLLGL